LFSPSLTRWMAVDALVVMVSGVPPAIAVVETAMPEAASTSAIAVAAHELAIVLVTGSSPLRTPELRSLPRITWPPLPKPRPT
jgi:hypothetical protein